MQPPANLTQNAEKPISSKPFPGSLTPGWNDPPPLTEKKNTGPKRLNLNKRVAFPLTGASDDNSSPAQISNMPPLINNNNGQMPTGPSLPIFLPHNTPSNTQSDSNQRAMYQQANGAEINM